MTIFDVTRPTRACRHGCGATVIAFTDEVGLLRHVDATPCASTVDVDGPAIRRRLWHDHGRWTGWASVPCLDRPLLRQGVAVYVEHDCPATPEHLRPNTTGSVPTITRNITTTIKEVSRDCTSRRPFRRARRTLRHQIQPARGTVAAGYAARIAA